MWKLVENLDEIDVGKHYAVLEGDKVLAEGLLIDNSDGTKSLYTPEKGMVKLPEVELKVEVETGDTISTFWLNEISCRYTIFKWKNKAPLFELKDVLKLQN